MNSGYSLFGSIVITSLTKFNFFLSTKPIQISKRPIIPDILDAAKIIELARDTIQIEERTLSALAAGLGDSFVDAIKSIHGSDGRLVVTGIGKSALIGHKLVATFNSTGTPALFMHAADAVHGDIGMLLEEDILLILSKSGETAEIKALVPLVREKGNSILAIVSKEDSYLAQHADVVIEAKVEKEADPHNLAPTASTVAQLALGDAMAVCLLNLKGFGKTDFATLHPGGTLGKQLYLRVSDIYPRHEVPRVLPDANVKEVILEISSKRLGATAVVNREEQVVGIITDGDLRRMLERFDQFSAVTADDIMTTSPKIIAPDELAIKAAEIIRENSIGQLLVVDGSRYLGIVHIHDLLKEGLV